MHFGFKTLLLILISFSLGLAQKGNLDKLFSRHEIERRALEKYVTQTNRKTLKYKEDFSVGTKDTVNANIMVADGDLSVRGIVKGDVLVLFGDVHLKAGSEVYGNVTAVNGSIYQDENSFVSGIQIETNVKNLFPAREFGKDYDEDVIDRYLGKYTHHYKREYSSVTVGNSDQDLLLRYNRVQGLFLGILFPKPQTDIRRRLVLHGFLGYGFADKKLRYKAEVNRGFFRSEKYRFELGASIYDKIESKDNWLISPSENTLAAFFLNDDYQDYYHRKGYELKASQNLGRWLKGTLAYRSDTYSSVPKVTDWALFKDKDRFAANPEIDEGLMKSWYAELKLDSRDDRRTPHAGWFGKLSAESSAKKRHSDFSFNQYIFELRTYQRISAYERLDIRLKAATSQGNVPIQKRFRIGGISTLRAFHYRSVRAGGTDGDRLLLANIEYNMHPRLFSSPFGMDEDVRYIIFFDAGTVWSRSDVSSKDAWNAGFTSLKWRKIKSDIGIALSNASGRFRINLAKRLDTNKKPYAVTVRLSKPF